MAQTDEYIPDYERVTVVMAGQYPIPIYIDKNDEGDVVPAYGADGQSVWCCSDVEWDKTLKKLVKKII